MVCLSHKTTRKKLIRETDYEQWHDGQEEVKTTNNRCEDSGITLMPVKEAQFEGKSNTSRKIKTVKTKKKVTAAAAASG